MIPTEIIDRYDTLLADSGYLSFCDSITSTSPMHLRWMLNELRTMTDVGKANRWLGFIQGILISEGWTTVQKERDFTRPLFKKED